MPPTFVLLLLFLFLLPPEVLSRTNCSFGHFRRRSSCVPCPPGTYQDGENATTCKPCPRGTFNPIRGAQGIDVCKECPSGTFQNRTSATSASDCLPCPPDTNSHPGSPRCISCPPENFIQICPRLFTQDFGHPFRGSCFQCMYTGYLPECTFPQPIEPECTPCPFGAVAPEANSLQCTFCPDGTFFNRDTRTCDPNLTCPLGQQLEIGRGDVCERCQNFQFRDATVESCETCPDGMIGESRRGSVRCVPCPSGTSRREYERTCRSCPPGHNTNVTGASFCMPDNTPCASGFFRDDGGACKTCSGYERYDPRRKRCVRCPSNAVSEGGLSRRCVRCGRGMRPYPELFRETRPRCICQPGFGFVPGSGGRRCRKCPPGTASRGFGYCRECDAGEFAARSGTETCEKCAEGFIQPRIGQRRCIRERCARGLVRLDASDQYLVLPKNRCVEPETNCPRGTTRVQQRTYWFPVCQAERCDAGSVLIRGMSLEEGQESDECLTCPVDHFYNERRQMCEECGNNEVSQGGTTRTCESCPEGFSSYPILPGQCFCANRRDMLNGRCTECPPGTFGLDNIDGCRPCPPGTFTDLPSRGSCRPCRAGFFTSDEGQSRCRRCPEGTTSFGFGETGCVEPGSLAS